jgi:NADPH-dependent ferric siderophore reductase
MLEVTAVEQITPAVRRLRTLVADAAGTATKLVHAPGQDLALTLALPDGGEVRRRYTIADLDASGEVMELEVVAHGDGPGARFMAGATPGTRVPAFGPRGKITLTPDALVHVFVGDEASSPAIRAMIRALPDRSRAIAVLDVAGPEEHRELHSSSGTGLEVHWLDRRDAPPEAPDRVLAALDGIETAVGRVHAYVFGEHHVVSAARRKLAERLPSDAISWKAYWRAGLANLGHGEPSRDE